VAAEKESAMISRLRRISLALGALAAGIVFPASAQVRTVLVSPVPGNPVASGNALVAAIAAIPGTPSAQDPWQIQLEPGIYEIQNLPLQMREGVSIEGAGQLETTVRGIFSSGLPPLTPVIRAASNTALRKLTVVADGPETARVIALGTAGASKFDARDLWITATGGFETCGLRVEGSSLLVSDVRISAKGRDTNYALLVTDTSLNVAINRAYLASHDAVVNYGIWVAEDSSLIEIRDTEIEAKRGEQNYGLFYHFSSTVQGTVTLSNVEVDAVSGSQRNDALNIATGGTFRLNQCDLTATGGTASHGVYRTSGGAVFVSNSTITANTATVVHNATLGIRSTGLLGGPVISGSGNLCAGVWDEAGVFYASTCPP
jgi:hypothetical protein